jgi:CheY-like chemotaxis protein
MEGYVTLYVTTLVDGQNKNDIWLSVTVSDTGIGIKPGDIEKLFSDYKQLDTKNNRKIEGTGLGLAITKELVEKMDGKISVQSEYGKGSSFHVIIRQNRVNEKTLGVEIVKNLCAFHYMDEKQRASAALVRPDLSYARVLVVDDFPTNLDVAAGMLRKYKMQVDCVSSGREAVDIVRSGEPVYDTIFMDHMMPEMDGVTATRLIRGMDSQYAKTVPIISLTANALAESEQMFLENGFNAFLSKPINILRLDAVVKRWIQKKDGSAESETAEAHEEVDGSDIKIPGLNALIGLDLCGGEMDTFRFALGSFISHTPNSIEKLRNVSRENLHNYAIAVHGLKGVCAAIGAEDARAKAYRLETAAKAGDLDTVLAENDALLQDAQTLVRDITDWLAKTEKVGWIFHQKA